jgi:hypothetical protein
VRSEIEEGGGLRWRSYGRWQWLRRRAVFNRNVTFAGGGEGRAETEGTPGLGRLNGRQPARMNQPWFDLPFRPLVLLAMCFAVIAQVPE